MLPVRGEHHGDTKADPFMVHGSPFGAEQARELSDGFADPH